MKALFEKSKYLNLIASLVLLVTSIFAVLWGAAKAFKVWSLMLKSYGQDPDISLGLIQLVDAFLIAVVLYFFAVGVYELFIGELALPDWMAVHDLHALKAKLSSERANYDSVTGRWRIHDYTLRRMGDRADRIERDAQPRTAPHRFDLPLVFALRGGT